MRMSHRRNDGPGEGSRALSYALRLLAPRARTEAEVRGRLEKKGFSRRSIEECIAGLKFDGLLNDEEFARQYLEYTRRRKPMGRMRLRRELQRRGVSRQLTAAMVEEISPEEEEDLARRALEERRDTSGVPGDPEERERRLRRLFSFLARRGFPRHVAFRVLDFHGG